VSRIRLLVSESFRSLTANLSTTVAATLTVLIAMFLVGVLIAFGSWARSWSKTNKEKLLVKVFYCTGSTCDKGEATPQQINNVRVTLASNRLVKSIDFVSKEEALSEMRKKRPELVRNLSYNPLPHAHEVKPRNGEDTERLAAALHPFPAGVEKVCPPPPGVKLDYGQDDCGRKATRKIIEVARLIEVLFLFGGSILLIAATILIANTIRLSIFSRRREIEVMKLVGASNWFVRGPFMLEGLLCGLAGSVAAAVLLLLGKVFVLPVILGDDDSDVRALAFELNVLILLGLGLLLGAIGSGLTLRRFLRV
jgi:cell division transport system permease protein